jgi:class 3 adenylate cyclase
MEPGSHAWLENERGDRIPVKGLCTFGRVPGNTVVIPTTHVSRRHAMIQEQDHEFCVVDLGSTNGIEINGVRVTHPTLLKTGDRLQLPSILFTFHQVTDPASTDPRLGTAAEQYAVTVPRYRMQNTWILLADLQGFTKRSQEMPPNEIAPMVGKWVASCQEIIRANKGVLAKFLGDGFMAYWTAYDETPAAIATACRAFNDLQKSAPIPFRIVVHYGEVSFGGQSPDAGNTMISKDLNFTFRLEKVGSRLKLLWIFSDEAASRLQAHLPLAPCGLQKIPDFEPERACFTLEA